MCGIASSMIFKSKGRDKVGGFFLGVVFGPFGIVFALLWSKDYKAIEHRDIDAGHFRKCPDCAELVKADARKCRFCNADLEPKYTPVTRLPVAGHAKNCGCRRCYVKA
jgi:hypothetical protein